MYLAHDEVLGRDVALKLLDRRLAGDEELVERFRREARSAASLSHPNIVPVYDWGPSGDGTYYIAMEYVPGGTLKDHIRREGALSPATAVGVAEQIAEALSAAHRKGVIHRDIKPQNVLVTDTGDIKVTDFGIARAANMTTMTKSGSIMGTAHYVSPEQAMGETIGPRSDLYSLGIVLYEMLTGNVPFDAETPIGIAMKHVNGRLVPPRDLNPGVPAWLNALTVKLLSKDPEDRPPDAETLVEALEARSENASPDAETRILPDRASSRPHPGRTDHIGQTKAYGPPPPPPVHPGNYGGGENRRRNGASRGMSRVLAWAVALVLLIGVGSLAALALDGRIGLLGGSPQPADDGRSVPDREEPTADSPPEQPLPVAPGSQYGEPSTSEPEPGTVDPADVEQAAGDYYRAAGVEDWDFTYDNLDSETQALFTREEWSQKNQWFADNGSVIYHIESVDVGSDPGNPLATVRLKITQDDGSASTRTTYFVYEDGAWKHRFGQEEMDLFMPEASYEEFVRAREV
ncbi:MAG: Serine/threonine protein kinase PrkC, regulator of stationary phase [uncultured Rubrobacteraceae bacterium]|uniref:non-specific serine/threonine protein kinase n=1 Tax=uncultured Rubrobacteraceae bacterium TaxID=349277 RepID=A0A6J4QWV1_9ACTN|nr:MAG: Serine/threonine protein kinase PrkC, regulator of stationary phase [uncultured Rubrobacteraceae bacterium]